MACYHPINAYPNGTTKNGKINLCFNKEIVQKYIFFGKKDQLVQVPCGQCIGCRLERSRQWAIRCVHESSLHSKNCFLTLTYSDENLPRTEYHVDTETGEKIPGVPTLNKRDIMLFMKRLRKKYGEGIRFLQCGEYGDRTNRPHHHIILFNHDFNDRTLWKINHGFPLFNSAELAVLWPYGHAVVADVTFESCAYVARYITKKITGPDSHKHYVCRQPEYITMSRRPGIARLWYDKFRNDVYPADACILRTGSKQMIARPPKYYDRIYDLQENESFCRIKEKRVNMAKLSLHNSPERLAIREAVQKLQFAKLIRPYENNKEC